jgi:hypothetical protein
VIRIEGLTETQIRAYVIADNRLAEIAGWDDDILAKELQLLTLDIDFDVEARLQLRPPVGRRLSIQSL